MKRLIVSALAAAAGFFGIANAQQGVDFGAVQANGYGILNPQSHQTYLAANGFTVLGQQPEPGGNGNIVIYRAPNGVPVALKYRVCGTPGCLFLELIAPLPANVLPQPISLADANDFNRNSPTTAMTVETEGGIAFRYKLPAAKDCFDNCQQSIIAPFMSSTFAVYQRMEQLRSQREVAFTPSVDATAEFVDAMVDSFAMPEATAVGFHSDDVTIIRPDFEVDGSLLVEAFFFAAREMEGVSSFHINDATKKDAAK